MFYILLKKLIKSIKISCCMIKAVSGKRRWEPQLILPLPCKDAFTYFRHRMWQSVQHSAIQWARNISTTSPLQIQRRAWTLCMTRLSSALVNTGQRSSVCITVHRWVFFAWSTTSAWAICCSCLCRPCAVFHCCCNLGFLFKSSLSVVFLLDMGECESSLVFTRPALSARQ